MTNPVVAAAQEAAMASVEHANAANGRQGASSKPSGSASRRSKKHGRGNHSAPTPASSAGPSRDASPGRRHEQHTANGRHAADDDDASDDEFGDEAGEMSFVIDTAGDMVVDREIALDDTAQPDSGETHVEAGLLLPSHVNVIPEADAAPLASGSGAAADGAPARDDSELEGELGDFEQLDMDPSAANRYYGAEEKAERRAKEQCVACGELGHDRRHCPHQHCLACGAMDEHPTRFCPLSTSCFRCGGMGHQTRTCPKPRRGPRSEECERCGAYTHVKALCPTLWRVYTYRTPEEHARHHAKAFFKLSSTVGGRDPRRDLEPDGDEISDSDDDFVLAGEPEAAAAAGEFDPARRWCYNCSSADNHWGDDCPEPRANPTRGTGEPSAFSEFVSRLGPFGKTVASAPPVAGYGMPSAQFTFSVGSSATMHVATDTPPRRGTGKGEARVAIGKHVLASRESSRASSPGRERTVAFDRTEAVEVDGGFLTRKEKRKGKMPLPEKLFAQWVREKHQYPEHAHEIRAALERRADLEAKGQDASGVASTRDIVGEQKWNRTRDERSEERSGGRSGDRSGGRSGDRSGGRSGDRSGGRSGDSGGRSGGRSGRQADDEAGRAYKKRRVGSGSDTDSSVESKPTRRRKRRGDGKNPRPHTGWSHSGDAAPAHARGHKSTIAAKAASKRPHDRSKPSNKRHNKPNHPNPNHSQPPKPRGGGSKYRGSYF